MTQKGLFKMAFLVIMSSLLYVHTICDLHYNRDNKDDFSMDLRSVNITLGMIKHGGESFIEKIVDIQTCNVSLYIYTVDLRQTFDVFRTAYQLENQHSVDVIVLLHNTTVNTNIGPLSTISTPLIEWGRRPAFSPLYVHHKTDTDPTMCSISRADNTTGQLFCYDSYQVNAFQQEVGNNTLLATHVEVRVPSILAPIIVKALHWKKVFIFYEHSTEFDAGSLVDMLSMQGVKVILYNVELVEDLKRVVYEYYIKVVPVESRIQFVVLCRFNCLRKIFSHVNTLDEQRGTTKTLLKQFSRWLIAAYDHTNDITETLKSCAFDLDNVAFIAFPKVTAGNLERGFKLDLFSVVSEALFEEAIDNDININETDLSEHIKGNIMERLREKARDSVPGSSCAGLRVETMMWKKDGRYFNNVGLITMSGTIIIHSNIFPNTNHGYNMRIFNVSTLHYAPFVIKTEVNGTVEFGGICMDLLRQLARTLNFTFTLTEPPDKKWGSPMDENLTFNGMIGQLQREEIDIVAADISIQKEREEVMDFMFPFFYGDTSVLLKKPDPNKRKWRTLLDPLKQEVLLYIGILLPIASLLAFLLEKFNPYYSVPENARQAKESYGLHTFHDSFWYMYGALLSQGGINLPESNAGRTFVSCWWLFSIVIVGIYCGNLIAFLTVSREKPPFDTLDEMADLKGEYKWGLQAGTHWEYVFKTSKRKEFRRVGDILIEFNKTDPSVLATNVDVHLDNVRGGAYGWIGDTVIMEMEMAKDCDLMMIKERFLPLKYAFGFTNNSPHLQIFSKQMLSIHESGLLQVWKRRWWPKARAICAGSIVTESKAISVIDVQSAFYVAAGGAVLGFIAFLMEIAVSKILKYRRRNNGAGSETQSEMKITNTEE